MNNPFDNILSKEIILALTIAIIAWVGKLKSIDAPEAVIIEIVIFLAISIFWRWRLSYSDSLKPVQIAIISILKRISWRWLALGLLLSLGVYCVFVMSIIFVNTFTRTLENVLYGSVAVASILGTGWGFIWATYIQKALFVRNNQR